MTTQNPLGPHCPDVSLFDDEACVLPDEHHGEHKGSSGARWMDLPDGGWRWDPPAKEMDLADEVDLLKAQIQLMSPPAGLFLAENGHGHLCIWMETEDERFPRQVFNLAHTTIEFFELIKSWLERVLPFRSDGEDK